MQCSQHNGDVYCQNLIRLILDMGSKSDLQRWVFHRLLVARIDAILVNVCPDWACNDSRRRIKYLSNE